MVASLRPNRYSGKIDVWAVGVLLFTMLSQCFPFSPHVGNNGALEVTAKPLIPAFLMLGALSRDD